MVRLDGVSTFEEAVNAVLVFLQHRLGFDLCMFTRVEEDDWVVLQIQDRSYGIPRGKVLRWANSFCKQMVAGQGPRIAPDSQAVPAYAAASVASQLTIGAYAGVPLHYEDGRLFGTLCAINPTPKPRSLEAELPLLELLGRMLNSLLVAELRLVEQARRLERAEAAALTDELTQLYNRRGWNQMLQAEEQRCRSLGHPAGVVVIDLDGLKEVNDSLGHARGDELIVRAARGLSRATRAQDVLARVGGDEFAVLAMDCSSEGAEALRQRLEQSLRQEGVKASLGLALRNPGRDLWWAWDEADRAMYLQKKLGRRDRVQVANA